MARKGKAPAPPQRAIHPLAALIAVNARVLFEAQSRWKNINQLGNAIAAEGTISKSSVRNLFQPERRALGHGGQPTVPSLESIYAVAKAFDVSLWEFFHPDLQSQRLKNTVYATIITAIEHDHHAKDLRDALSRTGLVSPKDELERRARASALAVKINAP